MPVQVSTKLSVGTCLCADGMEIGIRSLRLLAFTQNRIGDGRSVVIQSTVRREWTSGSGPDLD